jgi:hypothetical protein
MMETTFSMTRVQHIMRRDLIENWKSNLYGLLGIFAACFFPMLGFLWSAERWMEEGYPEVYSFERFCGNVLGIIGMVVSVAMIYYASRIMKCMDNKEKRISYLLLPATKLEKFFSRALFVTVGTALMILVALLALELTHYLLLPLFDLPAVYSQSMLVEVFSMRWAHASVDATGEPVYSWWLMQLLVWIFCLWNHSLFILGGSFWYKHPFLKTIGACLAVTILGGILFANLAEGVFLARFSDWMQEHYQDTPQTVNGLLTIISVVFLLFTVFNWWLSYRLFTRSEVVKRKLWRL